MAAMAAAAVGMGLFTIGCGASVPSSLNTSKAKDLADKGKEAVTQASNKAAEVGEIGKKLADATTEVNKELDPLKAAFEKLKAKITTDEKAAGADAGKMASLQGLKEVKDKAEKLMGEVTEKIKGLTNLKDITSLDGAKKAILEIVAKLKDVLKDYLTK
jgi:uncharacterized coiled-coil DUF342 family protein